MKLKELIIKLQKAQEMASQMGHGDIEVAVFTDKEYSRISINRISMHASNALDKSRWSVRIIV